MKVNLNGKEGFGIGDCGLGILGKRNAEFGKSYLVENTDLFRGWGPSAAPNLEDSGGAMEGSRFAGR